MSTVPVEGLRGFVEGAFTRRGREIDGGSIIEPAEVLWLTVYPFFADIRLRTSPELLHELDATQAFSGKISVEGDVVCWQHDLDTLGRGAEHEDANPVHGDRDLLVEVGENYTEYWHRVDVGRGVRAVLQLIDGDTTARARIIVDGDRAIAIWRTPSYGASLYVDEAGWQQRFTIGEPSEEDVAAILRAISGAGEIPVRWSVLTCQHR